MFNQIWFVFDLLCGFLLGLILIYFYGKIKSSFMSYFLPQKRAEHHFDNPLKSSKSWMYEGTDELHTFSFALKKICLIEIRENVLLVFQPSKEPDHKLNDDELDSKVSVNQVRMYNLNDALIGLSPRDMARSKYWSIKSPIVLENLLYLGDQWIETVSASLSPLASVDDGNHQRKTLVLFARTSRSKEDWFYRFVNTSQLDFWKKEIRAQCEQKQKFDQHTEIPWIKNVSRNKKMLRDESDPEHQKRLIEFLQRTDRFTSPNRLTHVKSSDLGQRVLPTMKKAEQLDERSKRSHDFQESVEKISLTNHPKHEHFNQSSMEKNQVKQRSRLKKKPNQQSSSLHFNQMQTTKEPLLFFVLKYLQTLPTQTKGNSIMNPILLINTFAARCFLDFLDNDRYLQRIRIFLLKQLQKIRIPFIDNIAITHLNLGDRLPEIIDVFKPWIDEHGLWSHLKVAYDGRFQLTLTIKLNWMRKGRVTDQISNKAAPLSGSARRIHVAGTRKHPLAKKRTWRQRFWPPTHWFRYGKSNFKTSPSSADTSEKQSISHLAKVKVKRSKTTIVIKSEVTNLNGILLFNIPPVPSDRLWISFLDMPEIEFSITPHFGEYRVPFHRIRNKLEKKLRQTLQRYLVMPNMKDFVIPTVNDYLSDLGMINVISTEREYTIN